MKHAALRERVLAANCALAESGLAVLTWGNASEVDRAAGVFAIKPSGVSYAALAAADIVILSLENGQAVDGALNPSSDTPTHWHLYREFAKVGGIVHTHSTYATAWAQACRAIPCMGTTHADQFHGPVPCTRELQQHEVETDYELNTGRVIGAHFGEHRLDPAAVPAVLVARHGPFCWGKSAAAAVACGVTLEAVAQMAAVTGSLAGREMEVPGYLLEKHYQRKHGSNAYYGQGKH